MWERCFLSEPEYISSQSSPSTTLQEHQGPRSLSPVSTMQPSTADAISPTRTTDIVTSHVTPSELQVNVLSSSIVQSTNSFPETAFIHYSMSSIDSVPSTSVHSELPALNQSTASSSYPGATITDLSHVRMATMTTSDLTMPLSSSASIHPTTSQPPATTSSSPSSTNRESPTTSATSASQWSSTDVTSRTPTNAVAQGTQVTPPSIQPSPDASKPTLEVPAPPTQPQPESSTPSKNDSTLEFVEVEGVSEAQVANNSTGYLLCVFKFKWSKVDITNICNLRHTSNCDIISCFYSRPVLSVADKFNSISLLQIKASGSKYKTQHEQKHSVYTTDIVYHDISTSSTLLLSRFRWRSVSCVAHRDRHVLGSAAPRRTRGHCLRRQVKRVHSIYSGHKLRFIVSRIRLL